MRIAIVCNDTRGGVQPYVALASALRCRGHDVRAVAPGDLAGLFDGSGVPVRPLSGSLEAFLRGAGGAVERGTLSALWLGMREAPRLMQAWTRETLEGCAGVDALVGGAGGMVLGLSVAEKLGVPFLEAHLQPVRAPTDAYPGVLTPWLPDWTGAAARRASHHVSDAILWKAFTAPMARARRELGLPGRVPASGTGPVVYGFSRRVVPFPDDGERRRVATGWWTLAPGAAWTPDPRLAEFVARPGPVVSIGFGSMPNRDAGAVTSLVVAAVRAAGVRAVLLTGWGGLEADGLPVDDVHVASAVPHAWLFPRMAAVVHHGGAGTTGAGLLAGVPSLLVPFTMDQPFWAGRVRALGVGPAPIPRRRLTIERLTAGLRQAVDDEAFRARAAALGEALRSEGGATDAAEVLDGALATLARGAA